MASFDIKISDNLTIDIRKCPHLLIVGKGDCYSEYAERLRLILDSAEKGISYKGDWVNVEQSWHNWKCGDRVAEELDERYDLLNALKMNSIEKFNTRYKYQHLSYGVFFVTPPIKTDNAASLKELLMKGRAAGFHVIMFADSVKDFGKDTDLLEMLPVKLVYKVKTAKESMVLTGYKGAEKLKDNEFMLCELGKKPVIYESKDI